MVKMNTFGARLKQARLAAQLSLRKLADLVGVTQTAIQKYEAGKIFPSSNILMKISEAVQVPVEYLFRPENISLEKIKFRKKASLGIKAFRAIEQQIIDQLERRLELENFYPKPLIKPFNKDEISFENINTLDDIENFALKLRKHWNLGLSPIHDLTDVLESHGVRVVQVDIEEKKFDGLFAFIKDEPIIVISKVWPGDRQRFNLAHELAHFLFKDILPPSIPEETACNRFAGSFLFPKQAVVQEFGKPRSAIELKELQLAKEEYGISMQAICFRLWDLMIINEPCFLKLLRDFRLKGWHIQEPGPKMPPEKAHVFQQMVFHALGEDYISESKAAELLKITLDKLIACRAVDDQKCCNS